MKHKRAALAGCSLTFLETFGVFVSGAQTPYALSYLRYVAVTWQVRGANVVLYRKLRRLRNLSSGSRLSQKWIAVSIIKDYFFDCAIREFYLQSLYGSSAHIR